MPAQTSGKPDQAPMRVFIRGRIDASRKYEQVHHTRILTPAPDAYSRPQTVEVRSKSRLGDNGDEVTLIATLGGYTRKPFKVNVDGETRMVTPVDHTLDVVE